MQSHIIGTSGVCAKRRGRRERPIVTKHSVGSEKTFEMVQVYNLHYFFEDFLNVRKQCQSG